jgi:hypothetical protein
MNDDSVRLGVVDYEQAARPITCGIPSTLQ